MATNKIAISLDQDLLVRLDRLVEAEVFPSRSRAIQEALREKIERLERTRLARACASLNPAIEQALAEEGVAEELDQWPEY